MDKASEEWIWVDGFKGTDKDMKCESDFQYELNKQYDMPDDAAIEACQSGFHLCRDLNDVFKYYEVCHEHRYFAVRALVRKEDYEQYGKYRKGAAFMPYEYRYVDMLVSKSIVFVRELTVDEILSSRTDITNWTDEHKQLAMKYGVNAVHDIVMTEELTALGYSQPFAKYVVSKNRYDVAYAVGTQEGLSMDMKALVIFG